MPRAPRPSFPLEAPPLHAFWDQVSVESWDAYPQPRKVSAGRRVHTNLVAQTI
ncbi:hypothetical protein PybrP1_007732, partial [[Pythium] brassicae (nom. inval.)]